MKNKTTMRLTILIIAFAMFFTESNAQVRVSYDYDKESNFSKFNSYKFTPQVMQLPINDLNKKRLITAISDELSKKGFSRSENPDILVDIKLITKLKQSATTTSDWYGSGYNYRWGPSFTTTEIDINEYMEGTIFIDFINSSTNKLIWQGRGIGTIQEHIKPEKREARISKAIVKIFKKYPPTQ